MTRNLYVALGSFGALCGVNITAYLLNLHKMVGAVTSSMIAEATAILAIMGVLYILLPERFKKNIFLIIPLALVGGAIFEMLTYFSLNSIETFMSIMGPYATYGIPTILAIGIPILIISGIVQRKRKFIIDITGKKGFLVNFFICLAFAAVILWIMIEFNVYDMWRNLIHL